MDEANELKQQIDGALDISDNIDEQKGKYMTFKSGNEYFGLAIQYVNEIIQIQEITAIPETDDFIKGLINLRGKIIPVIDVRLRFKHEEVEYDDRTCIIVISVKSTVIGLIVEKIAEVVEISDKDILPPPKIGHSGKEQNKYVYGIGKVGNAVKLLLDPDKLINYMDLASVEKSSDNKEEGREV